VGAEGAERRQEGDIVEARPPSPGIGFMEMSRFLWLRVEGLEDALVAKFCAGVVDGAERFDKRRYQIPLARLAAVVPGFDPALARDPSLVYQPFLVVDEESGHYLTAGAPLAAQGLIYDTVTGEYL
jgi:hypothetical protein